MTELSPEITQARQNAQSAGQAAATTGSEQFKVEDVLRQKIVNAYNASQDIVKPLDEATSTYLGAPQAGREKYQDIFNPFQRENLVAQYIGNQSLPMLSLSSLLGQRFGRIEDTIGAGIRGYQAINAAQQAKAELARSLYGDILSEYTTGEQLKSQALADQLAREKFEWDKANPSGGGGGLEGLISLFDSNGNGIPDFWENQQQTSVPTEPKPVHDPSVSFPESSGVPMRSPKGQWFWDWDSREWIPIVD